jgi:glucokinase
MADVAEPDARPAPVPPAIGVDIGGTKCLGVVVASDGSVVAATRAPTPHGEAALVAAVAGIVADLEALVPGAAGAPVGVGAPGLVTPDGVLRAAPNLVEVTEFPLGRLLRRRLGRAVHVDNDNTAATEAEWRVGAAAGASDAVYVGLGTGIGGGLVCGGRLVRGANGFAGEVGHMVVVPDGIPCVCGRRGCWERYASGSALGRLARDAAARGALAAVVGEVGGDPAALRGEHVMVAAADGDPDAVAVVDAFARWVALGLVNLVNTTDPAVVVVGGGLVEAGAVLVEPVRRHVAALLFSPANRPHPPVVAAALGARSGAIGAALLAREAGGEA